jgi:hypothetical protein
VHRRAVLQRDDPVVAIQSRVNLPLVGGAELRECPVLRRRAEAEEQEAFAKGSAIAGKVGDYVATGLAALDWNVSLPPLPVRKSWPPRPSRLLSPNCRPAHF